jgi:probable HAF family extracellular repeat protein
LQWYWKADFVKEGRLCSVAYAINSKGQLVGGSEDNCGGSNAQAFLWEYGSLVDLNAFISPGSGVQLTVALSINEGGAIASLGLLPNGDQHAFVLIPCDVGHSDEEGCDYSLADATAAAPQTSPAVRDASSRTLPPSLLRGMSRYHFPGRKFSPRN